MKAILLSIITICWVIPGLAQSTAIIIGDLDISGFKMRYPGKDIQSAVAEAEKSLIECLTINIRPIRSEASRPCVITGNGSYQCEYPVPKPEYGELNDRAYILQISDKENNPLELDTLRHVYPDKMVEHPIVIPFTHLFDISNQSSIISHPYPCPPCNDTTSSEEVYRWKRKFNQSNQKLRETHSLWYRDTSALRIRIRTLEAKELESQNTLIQKNRTIAQQSQEIEDLTKNNIDLARQLSKTKDFPLHNVCGCSEYNEKEGLVHLYVSMQNSTGQPIVPAFTDFEIEASYFEKQVYHEIDVSIKSIDTKDGFDGVFLTAEVQDPPERYAWQLKVNYRTGTPQQSKTIPLSELIFSDHKNPCSAAPLPNVPWASHPAPTKFIYAEKTLRKPVHTFFLPPKDYLMRVSYKGGLERSAFGESSIQAYQMRNCLLDSDNGLFPKNPKKDRQNHYQIIESKFHLSKDAPTDFLFLSFAYKIHIYFKVEVIDPETREVIGVKTFNRRNPNNTAFFRFQLAQGPSQPGSD